MSSLGKGQAEIDGILAGCEYLDLFDQYPSARRHGASPALDYDHASIPAYQRQETPDLGSFYRARCSSTAKVSPSGLGSPGRGGPGTPGKEHSRPSAAQWDALQTLRDGVDIMFVQFNNLSSDEDHHVDVIDRLREFYGDAKGMRQSGLLTYKDILQGMPPEDLRLEEIFAFSCLSYSLAKFLFVKGKLTETSVLRGLPVWREAVADGEKPAFDFLARSLWPEAGHILDAVEGVDLVPGIVPQLSTFSQDTQFMPGQDPLCFPSELSTTGAMFTAGLGLPQPTLTCDPSWLMPIPTLSDHAMELMLDSNTTFGFEEFQASGFAGETPDGYGSPLSYTDSICPSLADSPSSSQSPPPIDFSMDTQTPPPLVERMKSTDMFRVVSLWFSHMCELKELLWTLSGEGLFSQKTGKRGGFAVARQLRQFQDTMSEMFFAPLADGLPASMVDILKLTQSCVRDGVLSSLRDVEQHLFAISKAFNLSVEARKWFLEIVLKRCLKLSRTMTSCVYGCKTQEVYSERYIESKLDFSLGLQSPASSPSSAGSPPAKRSASQDTEDLAPEARPSKKSARVTCSTCGKSYSGHSNLSRHKKQEHRPGNPVSFRCKYAGCKKVCSRADNLKQHVELVHKKHDDV